jgi:hypothetical protein
MEREMRKVLRMLLVNMRVWAANVKEKTGAMKTLKLRKMLLVGLVKLNKGYFFERGK